MALASARVTCPCPTTSPNVFGRHFLESASYAMVPPWLGPAPLPWPLHHVPGPPARGGFPSGVARDLRPLAAVPLAGPATSLHRPPRGTPRIACRPRSRASAPAPEIHPHAICDNVPHP